MDSGRFDLTRGPIPGKLMRISLPLIGGQLMLMGYNLVDMLLLGRVGAGAVAASGSAGMFMWLASGLMLVGRMGAEIGVAQAKGAGDAAGAARYARNAMFLAASLGCLCGSICVAAPRPLVGFLAIREAEVAADAAEYLAIIGLGMPATFLIAGISGVFTGAGNSRTPFFINAAGLLLNVILDPLLIFTLGMGVKGAAVATTISQLAACLFGFERLLRWRAGPVTPALLLVRPSATAIRQLFAWTVPVSVENVLFSFFSMVVARRIAAYGADAIAVYRVGSQAESLCWLVCLGFSSGITAFVGQNFGAGHLLRIRRGIRAGLAFILSWGLAVSILFLTAGPFLTSLFIPDDRIAAMGGEYLRILSFCQIFFCLESIAAGAFRGLGRTIPPSVAGTVCNALRIPVVYLLSSTAMGLNGVWWGITLTAILRGVWVFTWYLLLTRSAHHTTDPESGESDASLSVESPGSARFLP